MLECSLLVICFILSLSWLYIFLLSIGLETGACCYGIYSRWFGMTTLLFLLAFMLKDNFFLMGIPELGLFFKETLGMYCSNTVLVFVFD